MSRYFFETTREAEKFVKENNIKTYKLQAPTLIDFGVEVIAETFVCEICKKETPFSCEGRERNTCAECMPFFVCRGECDGDY
jgi:hypothetical protein